MKKATIQIITLAVLLLAICAGSRLAMRNTFMASVPLQTAGIAPEDLRLSAEVPDIVEAGTPRLRRGMLQIPIRPRRPGTTYIDVNDSAGRDVSMLALHVSRFGTVYDSVTGGFTGDSVALTAFTAFCLAVAAIMFWAYRGAKGPMFYAYSTIHAVGFSLFALLTGLTMLTVTLRHLLDPKGYSMYSAYAAIAGASWRFMMLTGPCVLAFAAGMAVSNVALIRHEGFALKNALGIGVAIALAAGEAVAFALYSRDFSGSEWEVRLWDTLCNVYATGFAWFECMLAGAIICGLKAARHVPEPDADYILILGCKFRRDGTLTPLLRGRVDRAVEFWKRQREATGREAVLMPTGGQGPDECISEAEAMRRYLLSRGVPEESIAVEDQSRNTYQNMAFSRALIEKRAPGAKVVYATTNYHVFRSGVWASLAGMPAEGMGSRTKWWYWPNAFMRECAGLLLNRVPQELALLAALIAFFGMLSMVLR